MIMEVSSAKLTESVANGINCKLTHYYLNWWFHLKSACYIHTVVEQNGMHSFTMKY